MAEPEALAPFLADPISALMALDYLEARESFARFARVVEIPGAPLVDEDDEEDDPTETIKDPDRDVLYAPVSGPLAAHHHLMADVFMGIDAGIIRRAMFLMPPGSAKSTYGSVLFPPWFMGRKKRRNAAVISYGSDLARKLGRRARAVVKQEAYRSTFGVGLDPSTTAADEWNLDNENEFMAAGILAGITGNRYDLVVIDDPIKGRQQADSETIRQRTFEAYQDDVLTRLKPGGAVLLIQTRWHEDDLAGRILGEDYEGQSGWIEGTDGEWWFVVNLPAEAEHADDPLGRAPGQMLWPEWFTEDHWRPFRAQLRTWTSLFQQRPSPADGSFFLREWFDRYTPDQLPDYFNVYMTSDHAPAGGEDSDYQVIRAWAVDEKGELWLLSGGMREQCTMDVLGTQAAALIKGWRMRGHPVLCWFPEDDNNWKAAAPFIRNGLREAKAHVRIEPISPHGANKQVKATGFQGMAASGRVHVPAGVAGDAVMAQYLVFPNGKHDDEVDAAAIIGRALEDAHKAIVPVAKKVEVKKRYQKKRRPNAWATGV